MGQIDVSQPGRWRSIFVGSQGLRSGWCLLIFVMILAVPVIPVQLSVRHHHVEQPRVVNPVVLCLAELAVIALILAATALMAWIERRPFLSYGLRGPRWLSRFLAGSAAGLISLSLVVLVLYAGGFLVVDGFALQGAAIAGYAVLWLLAFFLVALAEELTFRGYLQTTLARGIGYWPAALVLSALFTLAHTGNHGESLLGLVGVFAAGMVLCLLLRAGGSIWPCVGFHMTWDWAQSYLYGVPDSAMVMQGHLLATHAAGDPAFSGGSAGPEGSVLALLVMVVAVSAAWYLRKKDVRF